MSDYLLRLARRAIPIQNSGPDKSPEVRPAAHHPGSPSANLQADFEIEEAAADQAIDANQPGSSSYQMVDPQSMMVLDRHEKKRDLLEHSLSQREPLRSGPEPVELFDELSSLALLDVQSEEIEPVSSIPAIETAASTDVKGFPYEGEQGITQDAHHAVEGQQPDFPHRDNILRPSPGVGGEEAMQDHIGVSEPAPQPGHRQVPIETDAPGDRAGASLLEPLIPPPTEASSSRPEQNRVVIGNLTVEVLPAVTQPQTIHPPVQVTRIVQPAPSRQNRSSKLRFGLRQM